ncbi:hypothetical protein ERD78_08725 [Allopusillimonas soli]|uniref:Uncharacterized protein n=1 Tax=Allopusillimonas soli TaxID=659016 RepID=A0A853FA27_9BURK|nr:hypothetical protein [Allopusillimonas soli]NYT36953.1 hypothetical protein [Allopusillimonas soli]TEA75404.1 hypothetical protein ERD78_08725 [Allopusillimonas soli]
MDKMLISVFVVAFATLAGGALFLILLIAAAGMEPGWWNAWRTWLRGKLARVIFVRARHGR